MRAPLGFILALTATAAAGGAEQPDGRLYLRLVHEETIVVVHPSGRIRVVPVPELAPGDPQFNLVRAGRRLVFYGGTRSGPAVFSVGLDLRAPRKLADAWAFVPAAREGRVWLMTLDPAGRDTRRAIASVREVTATGRLTLAPSPLPPARAIVGAVEAGLLVQADNRLDVWNPRAGEVTRRLPGPFPVATHGNMVAICKPRCARLLIADARTGATLRVAPPTSFAFETTYGGAFSPDGELVALPVVSRGNHDRRIALVDVASGATRVVPRSSLARDYSPIGWSSSGRWLYSRARGGRIMAYRRGSESASFLPARIAEPFVSLVAE
jgi:hypothetical protein